MCGKINFHIIAKSRCPSGYWKANRKRIVNVAKVKGQSSGWIGSGVWGPFKWFSGRITFLSRHDNCAKVEARHTICRQVGKSQSPPPWLRSTGPRHVLDRWPKTPKTPSGRVSLDLKLVYCLDCAMWSRRHLPPFASINGQNFQRTLAVLVTSSSAIVVEANNTPATLYVWCLLSLWQLWASGKDTPARTSLCWRCENKGYQSALIVWTIKFKPI